MDHATIHENTICRLIKEGFVKGMFIALVLVVAAVIGLGFYRGWWNFASDSTGAKVHLNVTVDKDKIQEDKKNGLGRVQDFGHQVKDRVTVPTKKSKDEAAPSMQPPQNKQ